MTIRAGLNQYLANKPELISLVGTRIYPGARPQGTSLPAIGFARLSGAHAHYITGGAGRADPRFLINCMAETYAGADALAEAVRGAMQGFNGAMGDVTVTACTLEDDSDQVDAPEDGSDRVLYHIPLVFKIQYRESIPTP
jgi:uncharacterized protein DUF3168